MCAFPGRCQSKPGRAPAWRPGPAKFTPLRAPGKPFTVWRMNAEPSAPGLRLLAFVALAVLSAAGVRAFTLSDLLSDSKMSPKRFAGYFEDFEFELHPFDVQDPDVFLQTQRGDCIDYAVMADYVLKKDGYVTKLIRVEMVGKNMGHAVCYVRESTAYLDYNNRKYLFKLKHAAGRLRDIATEVANSFDANWTFASEFTYTYKEDVKRAVMTVVKTDPPDTDPDAGGAARTGSGS